MSFEKIKVIEDDALHAIAALGSYGLKPDLLARIGAFVIYMGMIETRIEPLLWKMRKEEIKGTRPETDKQRTTEHITELEKLAVGADVMPAEFIKETSNLGRDLMAYRNALFHGAVMSLGPASKPSFISNGLWGGIQRKREPGDAHLSEPWGDAAPTCARVAVHAIQVLNQWADDRLEVSDMERLMPRLKQCANLAYEMRHISKMINHEKY